MAMKGVATFEPAGSGFLETFGRAPIGFHLGHGLAPYTPFRGVHMSRCTSGRIATLLFLLVTASVSVLTNSAGGTAAHSSLIRAFKEPQEHHLGFTPSFWG
jgi:hypothetical protein